MVLEPIASFQLHEVFVTLSDLLGPRPIIIIMLNQSDVTVENQKIFTEKTLVNRIWSFLNDAKEIL